MSFNNFIEIFKETWPQMCRLNTECKKWFSKLLIGCWLFINGNSNQMKSADEVSSISIIYLMLNTITGVQNFRI